MRRRSIRSEAELTFETLTLAGADVGYAADAFASRADALFDALHREIPWEQHRLHIFGREVASPRWSCWIGDPGTGYSYSGTHFAPHPWPLALQAIRARLAGELRIDFNSVLANLYREVNQ